MTMIPIRPLAVIFFMILSTTTFAHNASTDTTLVLGGPDRWDGSFEDATGAPAWHGWTHADLYNPSPQSFWEASDHLPLMGGYSAWCGTWFYNSCQDGYGNDWLDSLELSGTAADPAVATTVHWQAVVEVDSEPGYDYLYLQVGRGTSWEDVQAPIDGSGTWNIDLTFTIDPADYVDGTWRLRFLADSDNAWSDEDCNLDTQGLARVDNVIVTVDGMVVNDQDFEDGTLGAWLPHAASEVGDFTSLRRDLIDMDPDPARSNDSWQVTFIDDGEVVPGTGGTPCVNWCYGPFGWVFNVTAGLDGHGVSGQPFGLGNGGVWNGITSPALVWPEGADAGEIAFVVYAHMQTFECGATAYGWSFRATSATDPSALELVNWQTTRWSTFNPESMPPVCWSEYVTEGTPAPYFDNVAVRAWRSVSNVSMKGEALSLTTAPNPFNPRVTIRWSQPVAGPVELSIYDMRGHMVRQLVSGDRPAGSGEIFWDGRDDAGGGMATGIYLVRLKTSVGSELRKLTLMR
jgi:hypothetical protein